MEHPGVARTAGRHSATELATHGFRGGSHVPENWAADHAAECAPPAAGQRKHAFDSAGDRRRHGTQEAGEGGAGYQ